MDQFKLSSLAGKMGLNRKGQTIGLVGGIVFSLAMFIVFAIVALFMINTAVNSNLIATTQTTTMGVQNESGWINYTGYTLSGYNSSWSGITFVYAFNGTDDTPIGLANISESSGVITNTSALAWDDADLTYTYTLTYASTTQTTLDNLDANATTGVNKISEKIPTILAVAAIILILAIILVLIIVTRKFKVGKTFI